MLRNPQWLHRTLQQLEQLKREDAGKGIRHTGLRDVVLLKRAATLVTSCMAQETRREADTQPPADAADKLSIIMGFLRAVRKGLWQRARQLASRLDELSPFRNLRQRGGDLETALRQVQIQALEEAKRQFIEDLRAEQTKDVNVQDEEPQEKTPQQEDEERHFRASKKGQVLARLARLKPGAKTTISTLQDGQGNRFATTAEKLQHLHEHWQGIFTAKAFDAAAADRWFDKAYPNGAGLEHFPSKAPENWTISRKDIRKAIRLAGKSAPGPDGLTYGLWQALGETAVEHVWAAAKDLQSEQAAAVLEEAYQDEEGCNFNLGTPGLPTKKSFWPG